MRESSQIVNLVQFLASCFGSLINLHQLFTWCAETSEVGGLLHRLASSLSEKPFPGFEVHSLATSADEFLSVMFDDLLLLFGVAHGLPAFLNASIAISFSFSRDCPNASSSRSR